MRIGVISDTHSYLDPRVEKYFKEVDEIWHAGDVGNLSVIDQLKAIKPTIAVFGNIDDHIIRQELREIEVFERFGKKILLIHIGGRPGKYYQKAHNAILQHKPDIFVCGHSHILLVNYIKEMNMLHLNPGAAGNHGFHGVKTLLRFDIDDQGIKNLEIIELEKRP